MNNNEAINYLLSKESRQYKRSFYDEFLKRVNFSFSLKSVHITGTNGKGSVATYLNNIYVNNGYKVGCYKSPFLYKINEMILVNNKPVSDEVIANYINKYHDLFEQYGLTQFEIMTFIAFTYFKDINVDVAIVEVGMGGLIDATNIFVPSLSIITSIGIDHTQYLGKTIEEIATQKAGIIKENTPILLGFTTKEAENVVLNKSRQKHAQLYKAPKPTNIKVDDNGVSFLYNNEEEVHLKKQFALYESYNVSVVLTALKILQDKLPIDVEKTNVAIANTYQPARFSLVHKNPTIIIDGAHNPLAAMMLTNSLKAYTDEKPTIIYASFFDKDYTTQLNTYKFIANDIVLTTFAHPRAMKKVDFKNVDLTYVANHEELIKNLIKENKNKIFVITGSLAFASTVYKEFKEGLYDNEK